MCSKFAVAVGAAASNVMSYNEVPAYGTDSCTGDIAAAWCVGDATFETAGVSGDWGFGVVLARWTLSERLARGMLSECSKKAKW